MSRQLAEAKNRLGEVTTRALTDGPQRISRRGQAVVVLSEAEYQLTRDRAALIHSVAVAWRGSGASVRPAVRRVGRT